MFLFCFYSCAYHFEGQTGQKIKVTINRLNFANRSDCYTRRNPDSRFLQCVGNVSASLTFYEQPYRNVYPLAKHCLCSNMQDFLPFTYTTTSHTLHLEFVISGMNFMEDYRHYNVEGTYEFIRSPICTDRKVVTGSSGQIVFRAPSRTPEEVSAPKNGLRFAQIDNGLV